MQKVKQTTLMIVFFPFKTNKLKTNRVSKIYPKGHKIKILAAYIVIFHTESMY